MSAQANSLAHQASVVAINGRAVMIEGEPGIGKSALAHMLIDRGAVLIGDDGVMLDMRDGRLWAAPHPATRGLFEIRNVGIVTMPVVSARVALVLILARDAPRYVEKAACVLRGGCVIPALTLFADTPALPLRAEAALSLHGLE
ncbi:HPr kinase/phosphorylase [Croceicoccus hydrothermalis]|uniref:HPr kinase/phosphorylase n=1 Tax=Croceicoccus hydrothermalis TaxID=2867964 RepID=UPI001EFC0BE1|nr:serine kinase [Croceicoccus hydrothermalis]